MISPSARGRSSRVCHVVAAEMDNYEPCVYTDRVLEAVKVLRDQGKQGHGVLEKDTVHNDQGNGRNKSVAANTPE